MREFKEFTFTNKDYATLATMLPQCLWDEQTLVTLLRRKLSRASVVPSNEIPSTVVTMNSRVTFRVNDSQEHTRVIILNDTDRLVGMTLPVTSKRGLALLGMSEGQTVTLNEPNGRCETITVLEVAYQPEAVSDFHEGNTKTLQANNVFKRPVLRVVDNTLDYDRDTLEQMQR